MISLVIFGSRTAFPSYPQIRSALEDGLDVRIAEVSEIVCGEAAGADAQGRRYAEFRSLPIRSFPANWNLLGKRAGFVRNREMAEHATHGIGFWHRESKGTAHMAACLLALGKPVRLIEWKP